MPFLKSFLVDERAATAAEYGLILALVAGVIIAVVTTLGTSISGAFNSVSGRSDSLGSAQEMALYRGSSVAAVCDAGRARRPAGELTC